MRKIFTGLKKLAQKQTLPLVAAVLAACSCFAVPLDRGYLQYIDWRVLALLFSLMLVVAGWQKLGLFRQIGVLLSARVKTVRGLFWVLCGLCFFGSMVITNDVALITFVPFTIALLGQAGCEAQLIPALVLETISANLGSMLTPVGNPQNLYLYSLSGMSTGSFVLHMLPLAAFSLLLICAMIRLQKNRPFEGQTAQREPVLRRGRFWVFTALFAVAVAGVLRAVPYWAVLAVTAAAVLLMDRTLFTKVDYSLLASFVFFFVLVGNLGRVEVIRAFLSGAIHGRELWFGIGLSQFVSNVPATMLLSGFSREYGALLWGVNLGGLGTLIASMRLPSCSNATVCCGSTSNAVPNGCVFGSSSILRLCRRIT